MKNRSSRQQAVGSVTGLLFAVFLVSAFVAQPSPGKERSILFIGNSLTYTHDLPGIVRSLAEQKGINVHTVTLAKPDYALEDHWMEGDMQDLILKNRFDFVVVQQGPSSQAEGREMLLEYGERIRQLCESRGSKLAFFMVWPARHNLHTFDGVIKNYTDAAIATKALLCPVGTAWQEHFSATNDFSYYGPDQFHPSRQGSEVAAGIIVKTLF